MTGKKQQLPRRSWKHQTKPLNTKDASQLATVSRYVCYSPALCPCLYLIPAEVCARMCTYEPDK